MKLKYFAIFFVVLALMVGCKSMTPEETMVVGYVTTGETLITIHDVWKGLREAGRVSDEDNVKFNALFNRAKVLYKAMGDLEIVIIATKDAVAKKEYEQAFVVAGQELTALLRDISKIIAAIQGR